MEGSETSFPAHPVRITPEFIDPYHISPVISLPTGEASQSLCFAVSCMG